MFSTVPRSLLSCTNVIVPNRALAFVLTKCPALENPSLQCREYHEVTGNIICSNVVRGIDHLRDPRLNKGLAFTLEERQALGIHGLLAAKFKSQEEQLDICRISIDRYEDNLNKYLYLVELQVTSHDKVPSVKHKLKPCLKTFLSDVDFVRRASLEQFAMILTTGIA